MNTSVMVLAALVLCGLALVLLLPSLVSTRDWVRWLLVAAIVTATALLVVAMSIETWRMVND